MNKWKKILAVLRDQHGYTGDESLDAVKSFVDAKGIELFESDEKTHIDLAKAFDAAKVKTRVAIDDEPEPVKKSAPAVRTNKAARVDADNYQFAGNTRSSEDWAKKSYDQKIKTGKAIFSDADSAEAAGAFFRLATTQLKGVHSYAQRERDLEIIEKAGSSFNPATGGVLIPDEYRAAVMYVTEQRGIVRKLFNVQPMTRDNQKVPRISTIVTMSPIGQNPTMSATDAGFDLTEVTAKEWGVLVQLPNALLEDAAVNVADTYTRIFGEAQAKAEDDAGILGDGTSTYNGIAGLANGLVSGAYINASGSAWSNITEADIQKLPGQVENVDISRCAFLCSRQFYFQVMGPMLTSSGRGLQQEMLSINGSSGPMMANWKGWPVYFCQSCPTATASTTSHLYFGDFTAGATLGDRRQLNIATSEHVYFANNGFGIRATSRFGITVHGDGRGGTFGPIVALKTT